MTGSWGYLTADEIRAALLAGDKVSDGTFTFYLSCLNGRVYGECHYDPPCCEMEYDDIDGFLNSFEADKLTKVC